MKTSFRITLIAALLLAIILPSCNKYEEGPFISLASAKSRVVNKWKIEKVYSNESDVTTYFQFVYPNYSIELKTDDTYVITYTADTAETGGWSFDNPKENIMITPSGSVLTSTWTITRLMKDELWVKYSDWGNTRWEYHLITK